ncbi:MAG: M14 family zinc carboxypeptidase, partial [bacterium]
MKLLLCSVLLMLVLVSAMTACGGIGEKMLVRVFCDPSDLPRGLDVAGFKRFEWVDAIVDARTYGDLLSRGYHLEILIDDIDAHHRMVAGAYHGLQEVMDSLASIAANHPDIARLDTLPDSTYQGRPLLALKISDNVNIEEDEPELFFCGLHHAREWPTVEIVLFAADTLTRGYGIDSHISQIVDSRQIWLMPCVNPDGYFYSYDQNHQWWRKNRRYFPQYGTRGVDDNRNYGGSYDGSHLGEWGTTVVATSRNPGEDTYTGPVPMSEKE